MKLNDTAANDATMTKLREAAQAEAERRWPVPFVGRTAEMEDFANGAIWLASRLTREKVADVLAYQECKRTNPKADHPRMGYYAFEEGQRAHLRSLQYPAAEAILDLMIGDEE